MKKVIVITSIFPPTQAVKKFAEQPDHHVIVVGDNKTPEDWKCNRVEFISVLEQTLMPFEISSVLPFNHYSRKMIGYLKAIEMGADVIIDTDDDNIPKAGWVFPGFENNFDRISGNLGFINVYQLFTKQHIWPRGLPLSLILTKFNLEDRISATDCNVGVWQGLADDDPDVDAIYRLTYNQPCFFNERPPVVLGKGTICPFNSQNTMFRRELFPLLYLPTRVTFRFTDILRSLVAQPIMWLYGYQLGFTGATVVQQRNPHNYMNDFVSEIPMFQHTEHITETVSNAISPYEGIETNLFDAYLALFREKIVCREEMITLEAWLKDMKHPINVFTRLAPKQAT